MFDDDRSYYQGRAEVEVERAQAATLPCVVQVHYQLAEAYLERLAGTEPLPVAASANSWSAGPHNRVPES